MDIFNGKLSWGRMQDELDQYPDLPFKVLREVMQVVNVHGEVPPSTSEAALLEVQHLRSVTASEEFHRLSGRFEAKFEASVVTGNPVVFS